MAKKSKLEKKLDDYPRYAQIFIGVLATGLITIPALTVGAIAIGETAVTGARVGVGITAFIGVLKFLEYLVTEALKAVL